MKLSIATFQTQWALFPKKRALSASLLVVSVLSGAFIALVNHTPPAPINDMTLALASQLTDLQTEIKAVQIAVNKPSLPLENINAVTERINQLSKELTALRADSSEQLTKTLNLTEASLGSKINSIKDAVNHLDTKSPIAYLTPESLPFKVISLDSIQHIPVASIFYDYKTIPLEKGDSLAGWKVMAIDYSKQQIELVNAKKEHVLIKHSAIG